MSELPSWWQPLLTNVGAATTETFTRFEVPETGRESAVLVLLGETARGEPDILLLQRADDMRNHAGQPAFPGGAADPGDAGPIDTALREANEEVGLRRDTVSVQSLLPPLWIPVSNFIVRPVLAWWHSPHPVAPEDPREVASVARVSVAELVNPDNRVRVRHPSGWISPGFTVGNMLVWGFTAGVLSVLLDLGGWSRPWDPAGRIEDLSVA
jgi:8-oxo-dGTP pyrophosphatase MutT (NUDIX family)